MNKYYIMKLYELQWATGPNVKHAQPMAQRHQSPERDDYILVEIDIRRLFDQLHGDYKLDLDSEAGGGKSMSGRIPRAKEHWKSGGFMDPIYAGYSEYNDAFEISNGRHRAVAAYQMGETTIPALIPDYQLEVFKERLGAVEK